MSETPKNRVQKFVSNRSVLVRRAAIALGSVAGLAIAFGAVKAISAAKDKNLLGPDESILITENPDGSFTVSEVQDPQSTDN